MCGWVSVCVGELKGKWGKAAKGERGGRGEERGGVR